MIPLTFRTAARVDSPDEVDPAKDLITNGTYLYYSDRPIQALRKYDIDSFIIPDGAYYGFTEEQDPNDYYRYTGVYHAVTPARVTKVERLTGAALSSKCHADTNHYDVVFRYHFAPFADAFQGVGPRGGPGEVGSYRIAVTPPILTVGLNFDETLPEGPSDYTIHHLSTDEAQCAVFNGHVDYTSNGDAEPNTYFGSAYAGLRASPAFIEGAEIDLGTIANQASLRTPALIAQTFGHAGTARLVTTVKVGTVYQRGVVSVTVDGRRLKTEGQLSGGKLTLTLGSSFRAGVHSVTMQYPGGPGALPQSRTVSVTILR